MRKFLIALFTSFTGAAAVAQNCANPTTAPEVNECAMLQQRKTEKRLDAAYASLIKSLNRADAPGEDYSGRKKAVEASQRAWIAFRKADCDAIYKINESGSARTVAFHNCLQKHAERRMVDLKELGE
jgi:uncharacterized protein YecT (DUF1311 family)